MESVIKKGLSLFLAIVIIFSSAVVGLGEVDFSGLFAVGAKAASVDSLKFKLNSDGESYSVYAGDPFVEGNLVIPSSYNNKPVTAIGHQAFSGCERLTSITIPYGVTSIGSGAFRLCTNLSSVTIPDSVVRISHDVFYNCTSLDSITIPDSVTSIGIGAFDDTGYYNQSSNWENDILYIGDHLIAAKLSLSGTYTIKDGTKTIADAAFDGCRSLAAITFPDSLIGIGCIAFRNCSNLKSVIIPDSIKWIGEAAFVGCDGLVDIYITDLAAWCGIEYCHIEYDDYSDLFGLLEFADNLYINGELATDVVIPDGVTSIGDYAFYNCKTLTSITIPDSVTSIERDAFSWCDNLQYVFYNGSESDWADATINCWSEELADAIIHYNATDHTYGDMITVEPTCTKDGEKYCVCSVCGYKSVTETSPALGHSWVDDTCAVCGRDVSGANIQSPHPYENYTYETWTIYKEGADRIAVTFSDDTMVEWDSDWIYVYDGYDNYYKSYTGDELAGKRLVIPGDTVRISLETDSSVTYYGFSLDEVKVYYEECTHSETEIHGEYPAGCYDGYTGDTYCAECGVWLASGETIPSSGHSFIDDWCENCGASTWSYWINEDNEVIISGYNGNESNLIIPDELDGYPVTEIGAYAFEYNENIVSVTIPDTVETIGWAAFDGCINLTSVKLPKNLKTLDVFAFQDCKKLTSITLPDGLVEIGACAFWACEELTSIAIPGSVTSMGYNVFSNCKKLTSITIPDSVTGIDSSTFRYSGYYYNDSNWEDGVLYIGKHLLMASRSVPVEGSDVDEYIDIRAEGDYVVKQGTISIADWAFSGSYITSAEIPDSVKKISYGAFSSVKKLKSINVDSKNEFYTSVDGVLFNKDKTTLLTYPASKINKSYIIPNGVTNIAQGAFSGCEKIESVIIPDGVISIGSVAFSNCKNIKDVVIPDGVTSIGGSAFDGCTSLESIAIPKSVTEKNNAMFWDCYSLKYVFYSGTEEEWIELGIGYDDDNENINDAIFHFNATDHSCEWEYDYKNKTKTGVCSVCGDEIIKELVTSDVITFTLNSDGKSYTVTGCSKNYNGEIIIPQTYNGLPVTAINTDAFRDCTGITSVIISDSVTSIGGSAFRGCTNLKELYLPSNITSIPGAMCFGCKNLKSVVIPGSVTSVGGYAFGNCSALKCVFYEKNEIAWDKITIGSSNSPLTDASIHFNSTGEHSYTDEWIIDKMPACTDAGSKYRVCTVCNGVETVPIVATGHIWIGDICSVCGDENIQSPHPYENNMDETWTIHKEGADRIAITFSEDTFTEWDCDWIYIYDSDDNYKGSYSGDELAGRRIVVYGDTVKINLTTDGSVTYYGFSLDEVKVYYEACTHSETEIRNAYPADCYDGYTGNTYCVECEKLLEWGETIPGTGHSMVGNYCENCGTFLWDYWVNEEDEVIIDRYNGNESDVVIPDTIDGLPVTSIGWGCFHVCESLVSVTIPDSVTSIQDSAFLGCENLVSVTIPNSVTSIGVQAFLECTSLASITLPDSLIEIGYGAFGSCASLKSITIPDSVTEIGERAFGYSYDDDYGEEIKIPGFTIYGKEGSAAEAYAVENGFKFVPTTDEPELPIQGTEGTQIDYENFVIRTSVQSAEDIIEILGVSENATVEATPSYKCGDIELYGTGAIVSVYDGDEFVGDFTLVVEGDTNGDSVCDVLDCFEIERNSNGNNSLSGAYAMAGDTNADGVIDASDYQEAINKAVA